MLQVYKYDFYGTGDWGQNWMWQYSNPNLTLSDPKYLYFQTPISGTINLTLTNNTGSAISNTTSNTVSTSNYSNYIVQGSSGNYSLAYQSNRSVRYFNVTAGVTYTITDSISTTRTKNYGISATTTWPSSGNSRSLEGGGGSFKTTTTFTASVTGRCYVSFAPSESQTTNPSLTVTSASYNLILTAYTGDINVDLGQSTLAVNETITVPITLPSSTNSLTFYNNTGGASIPGHWPEISFPYTGWSTRNLSDGFIKYRSSGDWT